MPAPDERLPQGTQFPGQVGRIETLKRADSRFAELVERYHVVNRTLYWMGECIEPVSEEIEQASRLERLHLKDEIAQGRSGLRGEREYREARPRRSAARGGAATQRPGLHADVMCQAARR